MTTSLIKASAMSMSLTGTSTKQKGSTMSDYYSFRDHAEEMFGRLLDIDYLIKRAQSKGLTAVTGRPQMGKTWLLEQVGWLLETKHGSLLGYHESKGESDDHLLRAVLDLYRRWLSSASMRQQLESLFSRHKDRFVTGVGRIFGAIFKEYAPAGGLIEKACKGLGAAERDLKTGGIELPALDYDTCLSLVGIVSKEAQGKPIILILDAWEKSPTVRKVYNTLSAFLTHLSDWPNCHILLGIRDPELHTSEESQRPLELVRDLINSSSLAELKPLSPMDLSDPVERGRMLEHVRRIAKGARKFADDELTQMIDGFPGVIDRFQSPRTPDQVDDVEGLYDLAKDAQNYRYREFEKLLPSLHGERLIMAIRLALFQRLDKTAWLQFREVLCGGIQPTVWEQLRQQRILEPPSYPTYGHDARYDDALRRLKEMRPESVNRELETIVIGLAKRNKFIDDRDRHFVAALAGLQDKAQTLGVGEFHKTLCEAAESLFLPEFQHSSDLDAALAMTPEICPEAAYLIGTCIINRGVTKGQMGDSEGAIADYTAVIEMPDAPVDRIAQALNNRGGTKGQMDDSEGAIADYTAVIEMPDAPVDQIAKALNNRGGTKGQMGDSEGEIADYTAVIEMPDAPVDQIAKASANLALYLVKREMVSEALHAAVAAVLSDKLPDGGMSIVGWFVKHTDALKRIITDDCNPAALRGGALAFVAAAEGDQSDDQIKKWLKEDNLEEAIKIFWAINKIWTKHAAQLDRKE